MANKRIIVKRRKSVRNIRKITRTMQLIATARFQAALNRATATRPYVQKLEELAADIAAAGERVEHPLLEQREQLRRTALVAITSNRGLCGGYNASVLRTAVAHVDRRAEAGVDVGVYMAGKKGINYFRFLRRPLAERIMHIGEKPRFADVEPVANALMDRFRSGEIDAVDVAFMRFASVRSLQLLPLSAESLGGPAGKKASRSIDYEFSPAPEEILSELLPATVRIRLFQCFTEAAVSEQIARMVAMKAATDAAGDMIKSLTRQYNRARQTSITMELLDIVGGANALA
jgi:F-type H+-transporting ATPase subunit gamma